MRKRYKIFTLVLVFLASAFVIRLLLSGLNPPPHPAQVVPADSLLVVEWRDLAAKVRNFGESDIGKLFTDKAFAGTLTALDVAPGDVDRIVQNIRQVESAATKPWFSKVLSDSTIIALLAGKSDQSGNHPGISGNIVLLSQMSLGVWESAFVPSYSKKKGVRKVGTHQGIDLYSVELQPGEMVYAAYHNGIFFSGFSPEPVRRCLNLSIERLISPTTGMSDNGEYVALRKRAGIKSDFFFYLSGASPGPPFAENLEGQILEALGTSNLAVYRRLEKKTQYLELVYQFGTNEEGSQHPFTLNPPTTLENVLYLYPDIQMWLRTNWFDMSQVWEKGIKSSKILVSAGLYLLAERLYQYTELEVDEFMSLFGNNLQLMVDEIKTSALFPVPRICLCLELKQKEKFVELLDFVLAGLATDTTVIEGVEVVSLIMAQGLIRPSYAIVDDYFVFADSFEQLKRLLQPKPKEDRLQQSKAYKAVDFGLDRPSNLTLFARTGMLNQGIESLLTWGNILYQSNGDQRGKPSVVIEEFLLPILQSMKTVESKSLRTYLDNKTLVIQMALYTEE